MSTRHSARRRFLARYGPIFGRAETLRAWNGDDVKVEHTLHSPAKVSVRVDGEGPWLPLADTMRDFTEAGLNAGTGLRTMLRTLITR